MMNALNLYCSKKQILFVGEKTLPSSCRLFFFFFTIWINCVGFTFKSVLVETYVLFF